MEKTSRVWIIEEQAGAEYGPTGAPFWAWMAEEGHPRLFYIKENAEKFVNRLRKKGQNVRARCFEATEEILS